MQLRNLQEILTQEMYIKKIARDLKKIKIKTKKGSCGYYLRNH